eukprot:jgi/Undpi1/1539/HiC_scaffold_11.g04929.m1
MKVPPTSPAARRCWRRALPTGSPRTQVPCLRRRELPDVKKFLKDPEHATSYEDVEVNFVRGRPPVLTIYDKVSGEAEEKINLEKFNLEEMHELLVSRGFVRRPTPVTSADENSTNEGGSVRDQPSEEERRRMDAATAERKLKSAEARAVRTCMPARRLKSKARAEKRRFDKAKIKARANEEL